MLMLFQRKRTSKGFGVHSPFAFSFINKVINEKTPYYAYDDIHRYLLKNNVLKNKSSKINKLSFRLVNFFKPKSVLEIGSGKGINTLFITSPCKEISCVCVERDKGMTAMAHKLLEIRQNFIEFKKDIPQKKFDAVFIDLRFLEESSTLSIEDLLMCSHDKTFWYLQNINKNSVSKKFWKKIKKDQRIRITFDIKQSGIVILDPSYHKSTYFI